MMPPWFSHDNPFNEQILGSVIIDHQHYYAVIRNKKVIVIQIRKGSAEEISDPQKIKTVCREIFRRLI